MDFVRNSIVRIENICRLHGLNRLWTNDLYGILQAIFVQFCSILMFVRWKIEMWVGYQLEFISIPYATCVLDALAAAAPDPAHNNKFRSRAHPMCAKAFNAIVLVRRYVAMLEWKKAVQSEPQEFLLYPYFSLAGLLSFVQAYSLCTVYMHCIHVYILYTWGFACVCVCVCHQKRAHISIIIVLDYSVLRNCRVGICWYVWAPATVVEAIA